MQHKEENKHFRLTFMNNISLQKKYAYKKIAVFKCDMLQGEKGERQGR
jgi:hypothetical protein